MPVLKIEVNRPTDPVVGRRVVDRARQAINLAKRDPESMISVSIRSDVIASFGRSADEPAASLHLISFGLTPQVTADLTRRLSAIVWQELQVPANRAYIIYQNVPEPHLTAWDGRTFAEVLLQQSGGREDLPRRVRGRLVSRRNDPTPGRQLPALDAANRPVPLGELKIELWEADLPGSSAQPAGDGTAGRLLASGESAADGYFELYFQRPALSTEPPCVLSLRVYEPDQPVTVKKRPALRRFLAAQQPVPLSMRMPPQDDEGATDIPLGEIQIPFYEYDRSYPFPYAVPGSIRIGFSDRQDAEYRRAEDGSTAIGLALLGRLRSSREGLSVDDIQRVFPKNTTILMEEKVPGSSRADEFFATRLLNCFVPPLFRVAAGDPAEVSLEYNWRAFDRRPDLTLLSFKARFRTDGAALDPVAIAIGLGNEDDPAKFTQFGPGDGTDWLSAKRLVRAHHHNVIAQFQGHLAANHFNLEQYALAFMRTVRRSPVRNLLFPFLREVMAINEKGRATLVGGQDITGLIEPMQNKSLHKWIGDTIGRQDWKGWSPRTPLCTGHKYAHAANRYWEIVTEFVDSYLTRYKPQIGDRWAEVRAFSDALVVHALPYVGQGMEEPAGADDWYCRNEVSGTRSR